MTGGEGGGEVHWGIREKKISGILESETKLTSPPQKQSPAF
jgi:hypothetical protein